MSTSQTPENSEPLESQPSFQFGLRALFLLTAAICFVCVSYVKWGLAGAIYGAIAVQFVIGLSQRHMRMAGYAVLELLLLAMLHPLFIIPISRNSPRRYVCNRNLNQIAIALSNYETTYGQLPPVFIADKNGRPMHSWRVLILPFMDSQPLYDAYDFDEPWDGPNNHRLHNMVLRNFICPSNDKPGFVRTSYVAVWGPGTAFPGPNKTTKFADFTDGLKHTILLVEIPDSDIHWLEPRDISLDDFLTRRSAASGNPVLRAHPGGINIAFGDRHTQLLSTTVSNEDVLSALTIAGGEAPAEFCK